MNQPHLPAVLPALGRRGLLRTAFAAGLAAPFAARADALSVQSEWQAFRARFMKPDGRIVDTGNGDISHSESQGWGLLFSQAADDKDSFEQIFAWTSTNLARPNDALHVWKYDPNAEHPTADPNNATDGDIFIAWALARAGQRWGQPALSVAAAAIASDIRDKLFVQQSGQIFLLPAINGFAGAKAFTLNPSYYVFPAFDTLAMLAPSPAWATMRADGLELIQRGVFGKWGLPPDWLTVTRPDLTLSPAAAWPPRFSFDAIRVPLWLTWAGAMPSALGANFAGYWQAPGFPYRPAWVNLQDNSFSPFPAPAGINAVANLTVAALTGGAPTLPAVADAQDYYAAALTLLARMAASHMEMAANN